MDFSEALAKVKQGAHIARAGWNGKGMWLELVSQWHCANKLGAGRLPFIAMKTADGGFVPWLASQTDMLAEDWIEQAEPKAGKFAAGACVPLFEIMGKPDSAASNALSCAVGFQASQAGRDIRLSISALEFVDVRLDRSLNVNETIEWVQVAALKLGRAVAIFEIDPDAEGIWYRRSDIVVPVMPEEPRFVQRPVKSDHDWNGYSR